MHEFLLKIPADKSLFAFQEEVAHQMLHFLTTNESSGCYNACEQGLGKTIQAIIVVNTLSCSKVLIICPAVMRHTWAREFRSWSTQKSHKICVVEGMKNIKDIRNASVVICSYDLAARKPVLDALCFNQYTILIADEAHYLKNYTAKRTRAVLSKLWTRCNYRLLMSGTPFTNNIVDGYMPFSVLYPSYFNSFSAFASRYSYQEITPWNVKYFGVKNAEELSKIIRDNFYIRRTKEEVMPDLPSKTFSRVTLGNEYLVAFNPDEEEQAIEEAKALMAAIEKDQPVPAIPKTIATLKKLQGEKKVPAVVEFCRELLEQEIPLVIFAYHRSVIADLTESFSEYKPSVITGDTPANARQGQVDRFQEGQTNLFIGNLVAAGTGITLTRSCTVVLAELDWDPTKIAQPVDRVHRIGQKNNVTIYYFVVENSIDEDLIEMVMRKARAIAEVVEN